MLHDPSTVSARKISPTPHHRNFGRHVGDYTSLTCGLSTFEFGALMRWEDAAFMRGDGTLPADDPKILARIIKATVDKAKAALSTILQWCGDICRLAGGKLIFPKAQQELAYNQARSASARASVNVRHSRNVKADSQNETQHGASCDFSFGEKPFKNNEGDPTNVDRTIYPTSTTTSTKEGREDSCAKQAPHERPRGWGFPDLEEAPLKATTEPPSDSSEAASPTPEKKAGGRRKSPSGYTPEFQTFWDVCPKRAGSPGSKTAVFAKWGKLTPDEQAAVLAGAKRWAANAEAAGNVGTEYVPMIRTWFNGSCWETEPEPVVKRQEEREWSSMY